MTTIPSGEAARDAWDALPDGVRAEAVRLARSDQGHPDPAVAAIAVGRIRYERWQWWRTALSIAGLSLFFGECFALLLLGGSIHDATVAQDLVTLVPAAAGFAGVLAATMWMPKRILPRRAELANLRSFLTAPDAVAPKAGAADRRGLTRRRIAVGAAIVLGTAAVAWAAVALAGEPLRLRQGLETGFSGVIVLTILLAALSGWGRRLVRGRRGRREARAAEAGEDGLRFDGRPPIPWTDVLGVTLHGPTAARPDDDPVVIWVLRDAPAVQTPMGARPEELILAARAYLGAAKPTR